MMPTARRDCIFCCLMAVVANAPAADERSLVNPQTGGPVVGVSWKDYVDAQLMALEKTANATSTALAERLAGMNEFRKAISDQRESLEKRMGDSIPRSEYHVQHQALERQVAELREIAAEARGKATQTQVMVAYVFSGLACVSSMYSLIHGIYERKQKGTA